MMNINISGSNIIHDIVTGIANNSSNAPDLNPSNGNLPDNLDPKKQQRFEQLLGQQADDTKQPAPVQSGLPTPATAGPSGPAVCNKG